MFVLKKLSSKELMGLLLWFVGEFKSSSLHAGEHIRSELVDKLNIRQLVFKSRFQRSECTCVCYLDSQQSKL